MREKTRMDEDAMRWYFIEYISNNCNVDDLRKSDFERALSTCYGDPIEQDLQVLWELFMTAGQSVAQP